MHWVRVSNAQWHHYTQTWVKCSPHPSTQELTCSQHIGPYCLHCNAMHCIVLYCIVFVFVSRTTFSESCKTAILSVLSARSLMHEKASFREQHVLTSKFFQPRSLMIALCYLFLAL